MKFFRLCLVPFALVCVVLLRLLKGRVRLGRMMADRIGHLAGNTEVYLCERDAGLRSGFDIWCAERSANAYLLYMWARVLTIDMMGFGLIVMKVNRLFKGFEKYEVDPGNWDRDVNNLMEKQPPHLRFTPAELQRGISEKWRLGIPHGAKWVCLIVRDSTYLPELAYHSYRDSDIDTYEQAILALVGRGYYVIRMGVKVLKPLRIKHPKVIDYATKGQDDFLSLYLGAHCEFCLSNGCGFDAIPVIFRRPVCYVNYVPIEYLQTYNKGSLAIWKHHEKDGKRMTLLEIYASGAGHFQRADEFEEAGITLVDNTPEEIKAVALEMASRIEDYAAPPAWIQTFWDTFPRSISPYTQRQLHGEIRMRIGREFLKGYA